MRVLILVHGSGGDVYPQIAIGSALRARGHEVLFVTNPYFEAAVKRAGLEFIPTGSEAEGRQAIENPELWQRGKGLGVLFNGVLDAMPATYEIVRKYYEPGRTVVVGNALAFGARVAHDKLGVPLASVHLQPVLLRSLNEQPGVVTPPGWRPVVRPLRRVLTAMLDRWVFDPAIVPRLNQFRSGLGLPPVRRVLKEWIHSPQMVLGMFPEWYGRPQPDWPPNTYLTGFPLFDQTETESFSGEVEQFLEQGSAPLVFTAGTAMVFAQRFFAVSAAVCRKLGRRGLLLTRFAEQLPAELPPGVMHVPYAPFSALLRRASALVHHGGIGTASQALAAGIPQLVVPANFDQPDNAARLRRLGVAESVRAPGYTESAVTAALNRLLTSGEVRNACTDAALKIQRASDPMAATCRHIESLVVTEKAISIPAGQSR